MNRYIALLRGINVGGHKKMLMVDLRTLLESINLHNVKTYIQSGNVVFDAEVKLDFEQKIGEAIASKYGWKVPILVKNASELIKIIENCPFSEEKMKNSYFTLFKTKPTEVDKTAFESFSFPDEEFYLTNECLYFFCSTGYGRTKMNGNFIEKKLRVATTTRNYKTMIKLIEMAG